MSTLLFCIFFPGKLIRLLQKKKRWLKKGMFPLLINFLISIIIFLACVFQNYVLSRKDMFSAMFLIGAALFKSYFIEFFWNMNYYIKNSILYFPRRLNPPWRKIILKNIAESHGSDNLLNTFFFKNMQKKKCSAFLSQMPIPSTHEVPLTISYHLFLFQIV